MGLIGFIVWTLVFFTMLVVLCYKEAELRTATIATGVFLLIFTIFGDPGNIFLAVDWLLFAVLVSFNIPEIRRNYVSKQVLKFYKAVLPSMVHRSSGQIVIIGSPAGLFGTPLRSGYAASKHAVHGFFDCLRAEVAGNGIFVTNVIPGPIRTNMSISSLTGDGDTYGIMDKFMEYGISPAECANRTLTGIARKKEEVYVVTPALRRMLLIRRFFPRWFSKLAKDMAPR